jgi:hypothetical protein
MPAFTKVHQFIEDVFKAKHNFSADTFKLMLTNTAPSTATLQKSDITEIAAGNGYTAGGYTLTGVTAEQVAGVLSVTAADVAVTASGGSMAAWRYGVVYNDTVANDLVVGFVDRGSSVTLGAGESETIDLTTGNLISGS